MTSRQICCEKSHLKLSELFAQREKVCCILYVECIFTHGMPWSGDDQLDIRHFTRLDLAVVTAHLVAGMFYSAIGLGILPFCHFCDKLIGYRMGNR